MAFLFKKMVFKDVEGVERNGNSMRYRSIPVPVKKQELKEKKVRFIKPKKL